MPELPEVETVVRELKVLESGKIEQLHVYWPRTLEGSPTNFQKNLCGSILSKIFRRGKYLVFESDKGFAFTIHLRMTGKLIFNPAPKDLPYVRVRLDFSDGRQLYFVDVRKFGRWKLWPKSDELLPDLGPEPLNKKSVREALSQLKTSREIKKVLLDQSVLAGVGNIYADEALFAAKVHPCRPANKLTTENIHALATAIPAILKASIKNMGTTLSDYRNTKNVGGENQHYLKVYGQTGRPCSICSSAIEKMTIGQRSSHFCPSCQVL